MARVTCLILVLIALPFAVRPKSVTCPILMYHHLADMGNADDPEMRTWSVNPMDFDAQMGWLEANGYHAVTPARIAAALRDGPSLPAHPVCITFDDGWGEQYSVAFPILKQHRMTATFFVYTAGIDAGGWMSWAQLRELAAAGNDIQCHTIDHPALAGMPEAAVRRELGEPKALIEERLGWPVAVIAYPFGKYDDTVLRLAREAGYACGLSIDRGVIQTVGDIYKLKRVMVSNGAPLSAFVGAVVGR